MDARIKFGDSTLNRDKIIRLFAGRTVFNRIAFCSRPEAAIDVISDMVVGPIVADM